MACELLAAVVGSVSSSLSRDGTQALQCEPRVLGTGPPGSPGASLLPLKDGASFSSTLCPWTNRAASMWI